MTLRSVHDKTLLPPPAKIILLYAADGLSVWKNNYNNAGRPHTPSRSHWVPMFWQLAASYEGLRMLEKLTETGMNAWSCSPDVLNCAKDAFRDITFRALILAALDDFAETAQEDRKIILPNPTPKPYPPEPQEAPRPEHKATPVVHKPALHRPQMRLRAQKPEPK